MAKKRILLAGESWATATTHIKGYDLFHAAGYGTGCGPFLKAMADEPFEIVHMPSHIAAADFPATLEGERQGRANRSPRPRPGWRCRPCRSRSHATDRTPLAQPAKARPEQPQ